MITTKTFLFVSIDGMTDPLGQSQVLPYLVNLAKKGYKIGIISCEKKDNWELNSSTIKGIVSKANIKWNYCFYKNSTPIISQVQNYLSLKKLVLNEVKKNVNHTVLHCRSYIPGLIGLYSKKIFNTGFIFDMRGFWADERVEGGIWNKNSFIGSYLYSYFKKKEKEMLISSDYIISLTHKAKEIILDWKLFSNSSKITVIPCCVDLIHFSQDNINQKIVLDLKEKFPQLINKFIISYIGSLGTWYMADEMLSFFKILSKKTDSIFLIITKDHIDLIHHAAKKANVDLNKLIVISSSRKDIPSYISISSASIFFIKPIFSKSASSPTKMGELLSMSIPIITNKGIGDVDAIITDTQCGVTITNFTNESYEVAIDDLLGNKLSYKNNTINAANKHFSLKEGVEKFDLVYQKFI